MKRRLLHNSFQSSFDLRNIGASTIVVFNTFDPGASNNRMSGVYLKPDGTRMYTSVDVSSVAQYDLSIPWDITSNSFVSETSLGYSTAKGISFSGDGEKMYVARNTGIIYQYSLTTPWDNSSFTLDTTLATGVSSCEDLWWGGNGDYLYTLHTSSVRRYAAISPYSLTGISLSGTFNLTQGISQFGLALSPDGKKMYCSDSSTPNQTYQYILSSPFDITTCVYDYTASIAATMGLWYRLNGRYLLALSNSASTRLVSYNWE